MQTGEVNVKSAHTSHSAQESNPGPIILQAEQLPLSYKSVGSLYHLRLSARH